MKKLLLITVTLLSYVTVQTVQSQPTSIEDEPKSGESSSLADWRPIVYLVGEEAALKETVLEQANLTSFDSWLMYLKRSLEEGSLTKANIDDFLTVAEMKKTELTNLLKHVDQFLTAGVELKEQLSNKLKKAIEGLTFKQQAARVLLRDIKK